MAIDPVRQKLEEAAERADSAAESFYQVLVADRDTPVPVEGGFVDSMSKRIYDQVSTHVDEIEQGATDALAAATRAKASEDAAKASETTSASNASASTTAKDQAAASAAAAVVSANSAAGSASNASTKAAEAAQSAADAAASEDAVHADALAAQDSASAASASKDAASASATAAQVSATSASGSAGSASASATSASSSAATATAAKDAAKTSETNSKASEVAAKASETATAGSASAAGTSASQALASKNASATSAASASDSASAADDSRFKAAASATQAKVSENAAGTSAASALDSQGAAEDAALDAATSESISGTNAANAKASEIAAAASSASAEAAASQASASSASALASKNSASASESSATASAASANASKDSAQASATQAAASAASLGVLVRYSVSTESQLIADKSKFPDSAIIDIRSDGRSFQKVGQDLVQIKAPNALKAILLYATKAEADAAAVELPDGQVVLAPDANGVVSEYSVSSGALVKKPAKEPGVVNISDFANGRNNLSVLLPIAISLLPNGGTIKIPNNGIGYVFTSKLSLNKDGIVFVCDKGVMIDTTAISGSVSDAVVQIQGSYGPEINTEANLTTGDTVVKTIEPHNLQAGDWFIIRSQRACLTDDAGPDWRLGETTASVRSTFFAEPCQVKSVDGTKTVTISTGLIFPSYRIDNSQETYPSSRPRTTIEKLNFVKGFQWIGGKFKSRNTTTIQGILCDSPRVEVEVDLGLDPGHGVTMDSCLYPVVIASVVHDPKLVAVIDHSSYACLKEYGCWWAKWHYNGRYGMQGLDITYKSGMHPSIQPDCHVSAYDNVENSMTFHSGGYGGRVINPKSIRAKSRGIWIRTRGVEVIEPYIEGGIQGVNLQGWGGIGGGVSGGNYNSCSTGIVLERTGIADGPAFRPVTIRNPTFNKCQRGIYINGTEDTKATDELSGIVVQNVAGTNCTLELVRVENYVNGVTIDGVNSRENRGSNRSLVYTAPNSVRHIIRRIKGTNIGSANYLFNIGGISDEVTFPPAVYPNNGIRIEIESCEVVGSGTNGMFPANFVKGASVYTFMADDCVGVPIISGSAQARTWTIPANTFIPGARIEVIQGGAGQVTLAPASGVTVYSKNGLKTSGQYARVLIQQRTVNTWFVSGDTAV